MIRFQAAALELLEYKVDDYLHGQDVRGGSDSIWELFDHLQSHKSSLTPDERARLDRMADRIDEVQRSRSQTGRQTFESLMLGADPLAAEPSGDGGSAEDLVFPSLDDTGVEVVSDEVDARHDTPEIRAEREVLQVLAERAWWDDLEDFVQQAAASWRAERERSTARLMYATLQNLERYKQVEGFEKDVNLRRFTVGVPLPEREDPLVSFSDLESLAEIARNVVELVLSAQDDGGFLRRVEIPASGALDYVRQAATMVAQDPFAGRFSSLDRKGPTSEQVRVAIRELSKERMPEHQKAAQRKLLEQRLSEMLAYERSQRQMYQRDVLRFQDLVHGFFERLADHLPVSVGGRGSGPQLPSAVLFGVHPALRVEKVPAAAEAITARLLGPLRFTIGGIDVAVTEPGGNRTLWVADQEHALGRRLAVQVDRKRLNAYFEKDYLHVRVRDHGRSLASLTAEALVLFYVSTRAERDSLIAILKVISSTVRGDPHNLIPIAIDRIGAITAEAPNRRAAIEGLLRGAARAVGAAVDENVMMALVQRLHAAITAGPEDLPTILQLFDGAETGVHQLGGAPVTVDIAGMKLTLRDYPVTRPGTPMAVAVLPGQVIGSFSRYLLEPLGSGTLVCVRGEQEIAVAYVPDVAIAASRAV